MKISFSVALLLLCFNLSAQSFKIKHLVVEGAASPAQGTVKVDLNNRSININSNGRETQLTRVIFQKGQNGSLKCYRETVESKKRIIFEPNRELTEEKRDVSHIMTYTVVNPFSNQRSEVVYHLIKLNE